MSLENALAANTAALQALTNALLGVNAAVIPAAKPAAKNEPAKTLPGAAPTITEAELRKAFSDHMIALDKAGQDGRASGLSIMRALGLKNVGEKGGQKLADLPADKYGEALAMLEHTGA